MGRPCLNVFDFTNLVVSLNLHHCKIYVDIVVCHWGGSCSSIVCNKHI